MLPNKSDFHMPLKIHTHGSIHILLPHIRKLVLILFLRKKLSYKYNMKM